MQKGVRLSYDAAMRWFHRVAFQVVDIPTVSRWLGHKDGGALAMKVYGHLRCQHSVAMAQKVTFSKPRLDNGQDGSNVPIANANPDFLSARLPKHNESQLPLRG
jgi:hypothetical protein